MKQKLGLLLIIALLFSINVTSVSAANLSQFSDISTESIICDILQSDIGISLLTANISYEETYTHLRQFNPLLVELENRTDSVSVMINMLNEMQEEGHASISCATLGIILSQQVHLNKITAEDRANLQKIQAIEDLECISFNESSETPQSRGWLEEIITSLFPSFGYSEADIEAYTLSGERIPLLTSQYEYSATQKENYQAEILNEFPNLIIGGNPAKKYNCHSYAWYNDSYQNQNWLSEIDVYLNDSHTNIVYEPQVGAICVYIDSNDNPLHSAIVVSVQDDAIMCVSKWGNMGLYLHEKDYVPAAYKSNGTTTNCVYYIYPDDHTYSSNYNQYNDQYHTRACTICDKEESTPHVCTVTHNSLTHTLTCRICGWEKTQRHTYDIGGKCTVCSYQGGITPVPGI